VSRPEETILKSESGLGLKQKGDKKFSFNPPAGSLVLTDRRLIFAESGGEFAKRIVAGALLGGIVGSEAIRAMTKVKAEDLDKAFERPNSFQMNLDDILEVKTERVLGASFLSVQWNAPERPKALLYRSGFVSAFGGFDQWVSAVNAAKQSQSIPERPPAPPQAGPYYAVPEPSGLAPNPPQPLQTTPTYSPSTSLPVQPNTKFCIYCGARIPETASFCSACGKKQE
jgi:hypothetical protein